METLTRKELKKLLENYGHHASVYIPGKKGEEVCIMNNGMVYYPSGSQYGFSDNKTNAKNAMRFVKDNARIYSSVFNHITGEYNIED